MKRSSFRIRGILRGDTRCKLNDALMAFADHSECNAIAERTFGTLTFIFAHADARGPIRRDQAVHYRPVRAPT